MRDAWTMTDYVEQLIMLEEMCEIPWAEEKAWELRLEMMGKFTLEEREDIGLMF